MPLSEVLHPAPDPGISHSTITRVSARALAYALHRSVARVHHNGKPRCPEFRQVRIASIPWYGACTDCEQFYDDQIEKIPRRLAKIRRCVDSGIGSPDEELLIGFLRSNEAQQISLEEADDLLFAEARRRRAPGSGPARTWTEAWYRLLIARPAPLVIADANCSRAVQEGRAARPGRDLREAKWAAPLRDDPAGLEILISYVTRLRDDTADPQAIPPGHTGDLKRSEAARRLDAMLCRLRDLRPDWYAANVTVPLARRATSSVPPSEIHSLPGARPLWGSPDGETDPPGASSFTGQAALSAAASVGGFAAAGLLLPSLAGQADFTSVLLGAVRSVPVLLVLLLSFPALLLMPFLSQSRRDSILSELQGIREWHCRLFTRPSPPPEPGARRVTRPRG